ncbi:tetratricopeptide repeat protein [bacterium CPR1]|nr:tetratricopeptide repeat protein [bacterium CPR1]
MLVSLSIEQESPADHVARSQEIRSQAQDLDVTTAINLYRRAIEEQPENLVLRTDLADIHMNYGLLDDAVVQYRQIVMRKPQSVSLRHKLIQAHLWNDNFDEAAATLIEVADILIEHNMNQEALDSLQIVLSLDPHHFEARHKLVERFNQMGQSNLAAHHLRQLAEGALTKGNVELAISAFNQLMEISDDPTLEDRLAQVYESQGNQEEALRHLRNLSHRYQEAQRWEDAANVTERIIAQDPDNLEMRRSLIATYEGLKWHDKVVAQQFELANFYYRQGDLNQALELFETVVQSRPDFHEARRGLADVYLDVGRIEEAIKHTDTLTQHYLATMDHQTAIALYARLVDALPENTELREKLIKFYEVAQDPQNALAQWLILAELHEQNGRHEQAVTAYRKALDLDESRDDLHYRLALLYSEPLQNPNAALQELQRVHELNPGHVDAMERYVRMLLASGKAREGSEVILKLEKANKNGARVRQAVLDEFRDKIEAEPTDLRTRFTYGETCFHLQALDMAIEQFQFTRRDQAYELPSYNMLGMCFAEKTGFNMLDLAIKQFRKGLETKGHSEQDYLELRYNLAMLQYRNNRLQEALQELKDCYAVDIAYRDVREWIRRIESEIAGGPKVPPSRLK